MTGRKLPIGFRTCCLVGVEFSREERNVAAFAVERA